jgi:membrane protease YdiL (CAAX protease family)
MLIKLLKAFFLFLKTPVFIPNSKNRKEKIKDVFLYFTIGFTGSIILVLLSFNIFSGFDNNFAIVPQREEQILDDGIIIAILLVGFLAPIVEEFLFRLPLRLYYNTPKLKFAYYFSSVVFALLHIINYRLDSFQNFASFFILLPIFFGGLLLGYVRVAYGFKYSVMLHMLHNLAIVSILSIFNV